MPIVLHMYIVCRHVLDTNNHIYHIIEESKNYALVIIWLPIFLFWKGCGVVFTSRGLRPVRHFLD